MQNALRGDRDVYVSAAAAIVLGRSLLFGGGDDGGGVALGLEKDLFK